jgi:hypothetical protein
MVSFVFLFVELLKLSNLGEEMGFLEGDASPLESMQADDQELEGAGPQVEAVGESL